MSEQTSSSAASGYEPPSEPPLPPKPAKSASVWEDFIDIFYAPSTVFERRASSGFFLPMLVVTVLTGVLFLVNSGVLAPMMDAEMGRAVAAMQRKGTTLTPEQLDQMRSVNEKITKVVVFIVLPVGIFFTGLFLWLFGKFVESKQTLGQALMVSSYAFIPRVVEGVVTSVQGLLLDPASMNGRYRISLGVGRFLDPDTTSPLLLAIVGRLDVFTIWITVLLAIGLAVTGRIPRGKAAIAAALVWLIGALPGVLQAARM
ncbi:MAG: Yip1 protein [Gemmatimonadetes bacterium]|nr:Yip1 protein [Gemmatimonadota bacterium]